MMNDDTIPRIQRIENEPTSLNNVRVYLLNEKEKARTSYESVVNAPTRTDFNDPLYKKQAEAALKRLR